MAVLVATAMTRVFNYAGVRLPDPDPTMSLTEVRDFFANTGRPELTSAEVRGPEAAGTEQVFTLHRVTGTKGATVVLDLQRRQTAVARKASTAALNKLAQNLVVGAATLGDCASVEILTKNTGRNPIHLPSKAIRWMA